MPSIDQKENLLTRIKEISRLLKEGRYDEIDLSYIEKEDAETAGNLAEVIDGLKTTREKVKIDCQDLPLVTEHLAHISQSTENGIMTVINTAESIMNDTGDAMETLEAIEKHCGDNDALKDKIMGVTDMLLNIQNNCFSIITAVEFEDVNRQLLERILNRLEQLHENIKNTAALLKLEKCPDKKDSAFLESLKHIIDLENSDRQSQDMIDELFEDFQS